MPDSLLTALKLIFLALLYLFFFRVIRAVWVELREPKSVQVAVGPPPAPAPRRGARGTVRANGAGPRPSWAGGGSEPERLVMIDPSGRYGQAFELGDELTVGRAVGCGIALPDDTFVSTLHARVFRRDGSLYVEDLGSTNGTFVNDRQVTGTVPIHRGDRLQVGKTVLELPR
jgi:pSer/pThr/pTyr-binding forkhead associated (FHA) protein